MIDDDLFIIAMLSKGWWAIIFFILFLAAVFYSCRQEQKCGEDKVYLSEVDRCIDKNALTKPGE